MDLSSAYQTMCRKAHDIQKQWLPVKGDVYLLEGEARVHFWLDDTGPQIFRKGFALLRDQNIIRLEARTWLPRQHQLMDLAQVPGIRFQDMSFRFHSFAGNASDRSRNPDLNRFTTLEQLWLAFVMASRFGKRWDNHEWTLLTDVPA